LDDGFAEWIGNDRQRTVLAEDRLAEALGLTHGEVLLDYPEKTQMLGLDIPMVRRNGAVERLTDRGIVGAINLPLLSHELYRSARWLRVFTTGSMTADRQTVLDVIATS
jgi:hypothetical protein